MSARYSPGFAPFAARMQAEGLPDVAIRTFEFYYAQLRQGQTGLVPASTVEPVTDVPDVEAFPPELRVMGRAALPHTILLKLNGGLGTTMGLERAKSLLVAKEGLTFLDIIARQARHSGVRLLLMNSYNTHDDSLAVLRSYPELWGSIPLDFVQHKVPKVLVDSLEPADWPQNPALEWCPPGHGDIYTTLVTSGMLDILLAAGYRYAFVSNSDNLAAVLDPLILGYVVTRDLPFMMEVTERTEVDRKGGPLVRTRDGRFMLWESAVCPPEDMPLFQDVQRYRFFNTNNLWISLPALQAIMQSRQDILGLPMIRSRKTLDPRDSSSPAVYQLETAMGSAISIFPDAAAVRVPRTRFAPVKSTDDLLALRSDAYVLTEDYRVMGNPARRNGPPLVTLDPGYYRLIDEMEARFPHGAPSLVACDALAVQGDVRFGRGVQVRGTVRLANNRPEAVAIEDGMVLSEDRTW